MALDPYLLTFNPARRAVDERGVFTKEVADALTRLFAAFNANVSEANLMIDALDAAAYLSVTRRDAEPEPSVIAQPAAAKVAPTIILQR